MSSGRSKRQSGRSQPPALNKPAVVVPSSAKPNAEMEALRHRIDQLDEQIVRLINERADHARKIGAIKARDGIKPYNPSREIQVYKKVAARNKGPLPDQAFKAIYREIMSATIALEHPTRVAHFGQSGTFTHLAALTKFGSSVEYLPTRDIRDVFLAVSRGRADYGVVPIENSTEGGVNQSIDMFAETRLKIASEIFLPIHHHLLSKSPLKDIRIIYSHPQPFAQCRNWLMGNLGEVERREVASTAMAAEMAAKDPSSAAIAGRLAAETYGVPVVAEHIEDSADNITRFFVVAERMAERTGKDKTSLLLSIKDEPGALLRLLQPFQANRINLTRIESRPSKRRAWEYNFFLDLEGHVEDENVRNVLKQLEGQVKHLEVLGSYPTAERTTLARAK
ncbi:MAG TPA: prephenate dehydratase [Planctomycetota bacterium]|nr:prephenate dehydratase [Planctomycetota bacterium]